MRKRRTWEERRKESSISRKRGGKSRREEIGGEQTRVKGTSEEAKR